MPPSQYEEFEDATKRLAAILTLAVDEYSERMDRVLPEDEHTHPDIRGKYHCAVGAVLASMQFITTSILTDGPEEAVGAEETRSVLRIVREDGPPE